MHGSAQRVKQGLELERCALGQPQIVHIPARTLQIQCSHSPARALILLVSRCLREREGEGERESQRERKEGG